MDELHTQYVLTVEVLSPLHIGTGRELDRNYDFVTREGYSYFVDHDSLVEAVVGEDDFSTMQLGRPASELVTDEDFVNIPGVFRYAIPGEGSIRKLREQIKDVWGNPYLPGSSVKGALRTALIWGIHRGEKRQPDLERRDKNPKFAARDLERGILGKNPNYDILRALRVSDSEPQGIDRLRVETIRIFPTASRSGQQGLDVDVEALQAGTVFQNEVAVEEYGFEVVEIAERLGWGNRGYHLAENLGWVKRQRMWITRLAKIGQSHAGQRITDEVEYHKARGGPRGVLSFYNELVRLWDSLAENQWYAQLGWGTGWDSKTLGSLLRQDEQVFESLIKQYRLGHKKRSPGDHFPASRHLALRNGEPALPMGWVRLTLDEV